MSFGGKLCNVLYQKEEQHENTDHAKKTYTSNSKYTVHIYSRKSLS